MPPRQYSIMAAYWFNGVVVSGVAISGDRFSARRCVQPQIREGACRRAPLAFLQTPLT